MQKNGHIKHNRKTEIPSEKGGIISEIKIWSEESPIIENVDASLLSVVV